MRIRREIWRLLHSKRFKPLQSKPFCSSNKINEPTKNASNKKSSGNGTEVNVDESSSLSRHDAFKELDNLNFMTAAKILFSDQSKKKTFGLDFHLVQLFFAYMPSLAVYLVALYARSEMRRMEAELELKKQAEEEVKAKEREKEEAKGKEKEKEEASDPQLLEVKTRLDKLEETVKEIAIESKKKSSDHKGGVLVDDGETKHAARNESNKAYVGSSTPKGKSQKEVSDSEGSKSSEQVNGAPMKDQKSSRGTRPSPELKK